MIPIQSLLGGDGKSERVDTNAPQGKLSRDDAYKPKPVQEELLGRVRRDAEADAIRHAEDMANRSFPIVEEAESIGAQRIAALGAAYAAARSQIDVEIEVCGSRLEAATEQLRETEGALEEQDVPADRTGLAPIGERLVSRWQAALALLLGIGAGALLARSDLTPLGIVLVVLVALAAIVAVLSLRIGQPESALVTGLRRNHRREAGEVEDLQAQLKHEEALARGLVKETLRLVEAEVEFAKQLVASYESAASSALPPGALGEGDRAIRKQRTPQVPIPAWVEDLEADE